MAVRDKFGKLWVAVGKTFGLSQYAQLWLAGEDMPDRKQSKPTKPYKQVELVFACVNKLISGITGLPLVLSTIDEKIIEGGPAYDVLFNNPLMSWEKFITDTIGHYALSRDVFWVFTDMDGHRPKEIMVVSGTQMHPVTHNRQADGVLLRWEFRGTGGQRAQFELDEVYQVRNFNPYDRFHGIGPANAAELSINYSYGASLFNTSSLQNGAEPGTIITMQGSPTPEQQQTLRDNWDARHQGAGKAKRTAVLTGGADIKTVAMNMVDMAVAKITELSDKKICSAFGVPPGVVGLITQAQYSHGPAQKDFIFNTILPLAMLFGGEITRGILSKFYSSESHSHIVDVAKSKLYHGRRPAAKACFRLPRTKAVQAKKQIFAWFDTDQHPTVQEHQREVSEKVLKFTNAGVPLNQLIEAHDLPYESVEWGAYWWIGMGQVPANYILEAGIEGITGPALPEGEEPGAERSIQETVGAIKNELLREANETKDNEQQRLRLWRNWVTSWVGIEREYKDSLRVFFVRQQRVLLDKLKKAWAEFGSKSVTKDNAEQIVARVVFDLATENKKLTVINHAFFDKSTELGLRQAITEIQGLAGESLDAAVEQAKRNLTIRRALVIQSQKISGVNKVTQQRIARQLFEGLDNGEGLNDLAKRITAQLGGNRARAQSIAQTQTSGAVGTGRHVGLKESGVELKSWITSGDPTVRDSHVAAGQRYAEGIAVNLPFQVGSSMLMYPGDPAGTAEEIINCRCVEVARKAKGKMFDLAYWSNHKFYSYEDMKNGPKN